MKSFFCGDVVPGCDATFRADTDAAILGQVSRHARDDHGLAVVPSALADQVLLAIR